MVKDLSKDSGIVYILKAHIPDYLVRKIVRCVFIWPLSLQATTSDV